MRSSPATPYSTRRPTDFPRGVRIVRQLDLPAWRSFVDRFHGAIIRWSSLRLNGYKHAARHGCVVDADTPAARSKAMPARRASASVSM